VRIVGIETATELVGVAVDDGAGRRAAAWASGSRRHTEALAPTLVHVLEQAGLSLGQLEVVAVDVGPGLFTGLRVGVATAKGLAQGLGVGLVAVTSLDVLAHAAYDAGHQGPLLAVVDARRSEVFAAFYSGCRPDGLPVTEAPGALWRPEDLAAEVAGRPLLAVGDGARRYGELLGVPVAGSSLAGPPPASLVALAALRLAGGEVPQSPAEVHPVYLREADATVNFVERAPTGGG